MEELENVIEEVSVVESVQVVTIKSLTKLYKGDDEATFIELANCEEHNFDVVVQKGLYQVGDKAIYIQPDYNLPIPNENNVTLAQEFFKDFTEPDGNPNKTKLGKNGRIKAISFSFRTENSSDKLYSVGILFPVNELLKKMGLTELPTENLSELLEITKYEAPETAASGLTKGVLPSGMYSTDETNINNARINYPITLIGSLKVDGSSETIYYKNNIVKGICSRNLEKKLDQKQIVGYIDLNGNRLRKHYDLTNPDVPLRGWLNTSTNEFITDIPDTYEKVWENVDDSFVKIGVPYLEELEKYCVENNLQLALRGELCGEGLKGSGNKNNPHAKVKQQIQFYGVDDYSTGVTKKLPNDKFVEVINAIGGKTTDHIFTKEFNSLEEIKNECQKYFDDNLVEGIVLRNLDSTFSVKCMNLLYDSKK